MAKTAITVTVEIGLIEKAREKKINISAAAEDGILKQLNFQELQSNAEYPLELATLDPENYTINPMTGKCLKRNEPQFFENRGSSVVPLTRVEYIKKLGMRSRENISKVPASPKLGKSALHVNDDEKTFKGSPPPEDSNSDKGGEAERA